MTINKLFSKSSTSNSGISQELINNIDSGIEIIKAKKKKKDGNEKVAKVMREFKEGTLKDSHGNPVTDRAQAKAIAMSEAGLSKSEVEDIIKSQEDSESTITKAENLAVSEAFDSLMKGKKKKDDDESGSKTVSKEAKEAVHELLLEYEGKEVPDTKMHAIAKKYKINPHSLEAYVYSLASKHVSTDEGQKIKGGKADGKTVDAIAEKHDVTKEHIEAQLEIGMEVEKEHTDDEASAREVAMDHLMEDPSYYTSAKKKNWGKKEAEGETKKSILGDEAEAALDNLIKGKKEGMVAKQVTITRKGKTFTKTVYVKPGGDEGKKTDSKEDNNIPSPSKIRIKDDVIHASLQELKGKDHDVKKTQRLFVGGKMQNFYTVEHEGHEYTVAEEQAVTEGHPVGHIHEYEGKQYKKQENGNWLEVSKKGLTKEEHKVAAGYHHNSTDNTQKHIEDFRKLSDKEHTDEEVGLGSKKVDNKEESLEEMSARHKKELKDLRSKHEEAMESAKDVDATRGLRMKHSSALTEMHNRHANEIGHKSGKFIKVGDKEFELKLTNPTGTDNLHHYTDKAGAVYHQKPGEKLEDFKARAKKDIEDDFKFLTNKDTKKTGSEIDYSKVTDADLKKLYQSNMSTGTTKATPEFKAIHEELLKREKDPFSNLYLGKKEDKSRESFDAMSRRHNKEYMDLLESGDVSKTAVYDLATRHAKERKGHPEYKSSK